MDYEEKEAKIRDIKQAGTASAESELIKRVLAGDRRAEEQLFSPQLHHYVRRSLWRILFNDYEVEECVQDTMLTVYEGLEEFRGDSQFKTWVVGVARNKAYGIIRARSGPEIFESALEGDQTEERQTVGETSSTSATDRAPSDTPYDVLEGKQLLERFRQVKLHAQREVCGDTSVCFCISNKWLEAVEEGRTHKIPRLLKDKDGEADSAITIKEIAAHCATSNATVHLWLNRYIERLAEGLEHKGIARKTLGSNPANKTKEE